MSIYVEELLRVPMDALWTHTQTPALHERWDLRFSRIEYLPKRDGAPQRFRYTTRIGFGFEVSGEGETVGERHRADGSATSALKFGSSAPLSIIRDGSGYWKYVPTADGIRFLTWYDYRSRFGAAGRLFDRLIFRPMIGWATAWSFDRLRLWLEARVDPAIALRHTIIHVIARLTLAGVFAAQGLVPALLAAVLLFAWVSRWPVWMCLASTAIAAAIVAFRTPTSLAAAFNPVALSLPVASLAFIDLLVLDRVPSAARCRRHPAAVTS